MPSRRTKTVAINERISEAQKGRTRLACRVCRSRRIKCDGQKGACGRCRSDKRTDCSYENVGSAERMAGRQRKRALRKHNTSDSGSASTENGGGGGGGDEYSSSNSTRTTKQQLDWTSPVLTTPTIPRQSPLLLSPQQAQTLLQNAHSQSFSHPPISIKQSMSAQQGKTDAIDSDRQQHYQRPISITPLSLQKSLFNNNREEEPHQPSYPTSLPSDVSSPGAVGSMSMASSFPSTSWVELSPHLSVHQPHPGSNGISAQQQHQMSYTGLPQHPSPDYQPGNATEVDLGSIDSPWRVYDWQYRCNPSAPSQYITQTAGGSSFNP